VDPIFVPICVSSGSGAGISSSLDERSCLAKCGVPAELMVLVGGWLVPGDIRTLLDASDGLLTKEQSSALTDIWKPALAAANLNVWKVRMQIHIDDNLIYRKTTAEVEDLAKVLTDGIFTSVIENCQRQWSDVIFIDREIQPKKWTTAVIAAEIPSDCVSRWIRDVAGTTYLTPNDPMPKGFRENESKGHYFSTHYERTPYADTLILTLNQNFIDSDTHWKALVCSIDFYEDRNNRKLRIEMSVYHRDRYIDRYLDRYVDRTVLLWVKTAWCFLQTMPITESRSSHLKVRSCSNGVEGE
jgi:hypothetical protein